MAFRVNATFNKKRIMTKKRFDTKTQAQKFARYVNSKKPGANARVVQV